MHWTTLHVNEQKKAGFICLFFCVMNSMFMWENDCFCSLHQTKMYFLYSGRGLKGTIFPNIAPHPTKSKNTVIDKYNKEESS